MGELQSGDGKQRAFIPRRFVQNTKLAAVFDGPVCKNLSAFHNFVYFTEFPDDFCWQAKQAPAFAAAGAAYSGQCANFFRGTKAGMHKHTDTGNLDGSKSACSIFGPPGLVGGNLVIQYGDNKSVIVKPGQTVLCDFALNEHAVELFTGGRPEFFSGLEPWRCSCVSYLNKDIVDAQQLQDQPDTVTRFPLVVEYLLPFCHHPCQKGHIPGGGRT